MKSGRIPAVLVFLYAVSLSAIPVRADTLSWDAVTRYTDGTNIAPAMVSYRAYWTTDASLATGLTTIGSSTTSTSVNFEVAASGMPRGAVVYFTCKSTVNGMDSELASPLSWDVPTLGRGPSCPANLRLR